jgi:pyridoxine 5-phosphate synthase
LRPHAVCLVPEQREEVTTEGGLDVAGREAEVSHCVAALRAAGIRVSLFIEPDARQVAAGVRSGAEMVELHTGCFANAGSAARPRETVRLVAAAELAHRAGLQVNAGHGLNYRNLTELFTVPHLVELNIGHSIVSRAMRTGLGAAVREMKNLMAGYPGHAP